MKILILGAAGMIGRKLVERRRRVARALAQLLAELGNAVGIDHELLVAVEFLLPVGARVGGKPGRNHGPSYHGPSCRDPSQHGPPGRFRQERVRI